jgi:segregation and condensation protein B
VSERDPELGDARSEADEVLTSGADTVPAEEPNDASAQVAETLDAPEESAETLDIPLAELRPALEAVLMVADQPLDHVTLASAVGYPPGEVASALADLAGEYAEQGRGFDLRNVAGGWRFYTREEYAGVV